MTKSLPDTSIIHCKKCGEEKTRIRSGTYPNGKDIKWLDSEGKEFNGRTCPSCHKNKVKHSKHLHDSIKKALGE